jgi:AcrR family transcriptional regulator
MAEEVVGYPKKRARTRGQLRRAGMEVVGMRGAAGATVGEIVQVAEVAQGTFYNHFDSLDDLLAELAELLGTGVEIARDALDAVESDPSARVAIGVFQLVEMAERDAVAASAFVAMAAAKPDFRGRVRAIIGRAITDGVEADQFKVESVPGAVNVVLGACLQSMRSVILDNADHSVTHEVARIVLRALGVPSPKIPAILRRAGEALALREPVATDN